MKLSIKLNLIEKICGRQIEERSSISPTQLKINSNNLREGDYESFLHLSARKCLWGRPMSQPLHSLRSQHRAQKIIGT